MSSQVIFQVNGEECFVGVGMLVDFLIEFGMCLEFVVIEYNGSIILCFQFGEMVFVDGDRIEIVQFV